MGNRGRERGGEQGKSDTFSLASDKLGFCSIIPVRRRVNNKWKQQIVNTSAVISFMTFSHPPFHPTEWVHGKQGKGARRGAGEELYAFCMRPCWIVAVLV